jgi:hypothetical protein
MLTPSLPLSRSLDLPVCLARFPAARLWLKDAVTRVKERPGFQSLEDSANLPDPDIIATEIDSRIPIRSPLNNFEPSAAFAIIYTVRALGSQTCRPSRR